VFLKKKIQLFMQHCKPKQGLASISEKCAEGCQNCRKLAKKKCVQIPNIAKFPSQNKSSFEKIDNFISKKKKFCRRRRRKHWSGGCCLPKIRGKLLV
jgi:hypothetical protein